MNHNVVPEIIGNFSTHNKEMMFVLYMPVSLAKTYETIIPKHLEAYEDLVARAYGNFGDSWSHNVYLTVKRLWVEPGNLGGRLGWHTDGWGTEDINYVWCDTDPTEFCVQNFELSDDHLLSMAQMEKQARPENITRFDPGAILKIDARHVHRCPPMPKAGYRTFARVSFSKDRYDLVGNTRNYDLDYSWPMYHRGEVRNDTSKRK